MRRDEIKILTQGLSLPHTSICASTPLPPAQQLSSSPPPPPHQPHLFNEPEDTTGMAQVRVWSYTTQTSFSSVTSPSSSGTTFTSSAIVTTEETQLEEVEVKTAPAIPRTTEWRQRKKAAAGTIKRKVYTCRVCNQPMTTAGHSQFRGQCYCPNAPGQLPKKEWLAQKKAEAAAKK